MPIRRLLLLARCAMFLFICSPIAVQQAWAQSAPSPAASIGSDAAQMREGRPWEYGFFANGGVGTNDRDDFSFFSLGVHLGKVLTRPMGPGFVRGQFEYAGNIMPLWQSYTPAPHLAMLTYTDPAGNKQTGLFPVGGGTYTGVSVEPIILRWNLHTTRRFEPWVQGGGGVVWTNHKYPPDVLVPHGTPGGTSVFNFTPQFGIGGHYFLKPRRSIDFAANAVHISSASLGDHNPGVNASVQFQIGYTWWR